MGGRARIGAAYDRHKDFTSVGNTDTGWSVKGGWNFGVLDVGLAYETMKYKCGGTGNLAGSGNGQGINGLPAGGPTSGGACLAGEGDVNFDGLTPLGACTSFTSCELVLSASHTHRTVVPCFTVTFVGP